MTGITITRDLIDAADKLLVIFRDKVEIDAEILWDVLFRPGVVKIIITGYLTFNLFVFLVMRVWFQVSVFSAAAGLKSGQFDR